MRMPHEQLVERRTSSPVQVGTANVATAALGCPAERSSAVSCARRNSGLVSGHRFSDATNRPLSNATLGAEGRTPPPLLRPLLTLTLLAFLSLVPARTFAYAQEQPASQPPAPTSAEPAKDASQSAPEQKTIGGELAKETRESTGADEEEEYANLKHAASIQWLARKTGLSVHHAHMLALSLNFAVIVVIVFWAVRKFVPGMLRNRGAAIQRALEEARAASQDANRRLADIENRLRQLDVEIGRMQATAEKEAEAEEGRIQKAAEDDIRKVVLAAEQEIATAAKQARRELSTHTASLAIALARQQINVDSNTDQVLVRTFASKLASQNDGGKDGK
jgi:F-type H+-transporting ATPase subunit b